MNPLLIFCFLFFLLGGLILPNRIFANDLRITDFAVESVDTAANTITFSMNVTQANSWRNTTNHDAIWFFLKFSTNAGMSWTHGTMSASGTNPAGFFAPTNFTIIVPDDETGFFLHRTDLKAGNISANGVKFVWDYGQDGLTDAQAQAASTINKIFGIEMIYVPQGAFYAGDGNSSSDFHFKQGMADNDPWYVNSAAALTTTSSAADGFYYVSTGQNGENASGDVFILSESFPKGYNDFYLMKYELTEGQWVEFFNTLSPADKANRDITSAAQGGKNSDATVNRNTVLWNAANPMSNATTARPYRPVTYVSWMDVLAYADWAGLRPITELEFEKAARGKDVNPVANEFPWGTTSYNAVASGDIFPNADETGSEQILDGTVNLNRNNLAWTSGDGRPGGAAVGQKGPLRVGIFAESSTTRTTSGAGYYGHMELAGNLHEMVVTIGRPQGRQFLGTHGDGTLSTLSGYEGNATNWDWPGIDTTSNARGVTGTVGSGYRGGDFNSPATKYFQVSTRTLAVTDPNTVGANPRYDVSLGIFQGGRLGRTAP